MEPLFIPLDESRTATVKQRPQVRPYGPAEIQVTLYLWKPYQFQAFHFLLLVIKWLPWGRLSREHDNVLMLIKDILARQQPNPDRNSLGNTPSQGTPLGTSIDKPRIPKIPDTMSFDSSTPSSMQQVTHLTLHLLSIFQMSQYS